MTSMRCFSAAIPCLLLLPLASPNSPTIALGPVTGQTATSVTIHGTGFPPGEVVAIYIDQANPYWYIARPPGPTADPSGEINVSLKWPGSNYDPAKRVDPTKPGVHLVCADTSYPGNNQPIAAKACAQFTVPGPSPTPGTGPDQLPSLPLPIIGGAIVLVLALGIAGQWWMQRQVKR